jgi:hypothetical protein
MIDDAKAYPKIDGVVVASENAWPTGTLPFRILADGKLLLVWAEEKARVLAWLDNINAALKHPLKNARFSVSNQYADGHLGQATINLSEYDEHGDRVKMFAPDDVDVHPLRRIVL